MHTAKVVFVRDYMEDLTFDLLFRFIMAPCHNRIPHNPENDHSSIKGLPPPPSDANKIQKD